MFFFQSKVCGMKVDGYLRSGNAFVCDFYVEVKLYHNREICVVLPVRLQA